MSQVLPSGGGFATTALPELPDAPVRFSITMLVPRRCINPACARRATASTEPPGGKGTMIRIGPDGQVCACAAKGAKKVEMKVNDREPNRIERRDSIAIMRLPRPIVLGALVFDYPAILRALSRAVAREDALGRLRPSSSV